MNRRLKDVLKKMKRRMEDVWERTRIWWLQSWASLVVRCRKPTIVGVTGSVGKTTTKELIAAALSHKDARETVGLVWWSHGSMNDNDGLPLAVLGARLSENPLTGFRLVVHLAGAFAWPLHASGLSKGAGARVRRRSGKTASVASFQSRLQVWPS